MNKRFFSVLGVIAVIASAAMYMIGNKSANLSELKDFWWAPLPLALICFLIGARK